MYKCPSCGSDDLRVTAMVECWIDVEGTARAGSGAVGVFDDACEMFCAQCDHRGLPSTFLVPSPSLEDLYAHLNKLSARLRRLERKFPSPGAP